MPLSCDAILGALRDAGLLVGTRGPLPGACDGLADDSRQVRARGLFLAVRGTTRDGHDFLDAARDAGAAAAMVEDASRTDLPVIIVPAGSSRRAAALVAAAAHGWPANALRLVGVTGTNGKTTSVHMLRHLLDGEGGRAASIGTLGVRVGSPDRAVEGGSGLTTPGPVELQRIFRTVVDAGVRWVAMEMSSHALDQHRAEGVEFEAGLFTNLTRDHLDYHGTMERYFAAKALLVDQVAVHGAVVVNADDSAWDALPARGRRVRFSVAGRHADVWAADVALESRGSAFTLCVGAARLGVRLPLIGEFNVANAVGAAATAWALGVEPAVIARKLTGMPQVPGRMERLSDDPVVLRDYSHTPDSLERALQALRPFVRGRLICVFGAGGDRDRGKRPLMGAVAAQDADVVVVTSDNPRTEDPARIIDEIVAGIPGGGYVRLEDRRSAIAHALRIAQPGDAVLLAGKGHETYQVIGSTHHPFDERTIVHELLESDP